MKKAMINYMQNPKHDELYTPVEAIKPLLKYISDDWVVWEPTDHGRSNISKLFGEKGNSVIATHIDRGFDFFNTGEKSKFDCIVTNPPYSLKTEFLKRAYELKRPFALLLPITALEGIERGKLFRKYGIELLVLDRRINFMEEKKNNWFNTSWFCYKILPQQLIFEEVVK